MDGLVLPEHAQDRLEPPAGPGVGGCPVEARPLQPPGVPLVDLPGPDPLLEFRVPLHLGDPDGGVGSVCRVVVVAVVHEGLAERRGAVEARDPVAGEGADVFAPTHPEQVEPDARHPDRRDGGQDFDDLGALEWNHPAESDGFVPETLQFPNAVGVGRGAPSLRRPDGFERAPPGGVPVEEFGGEGEGDRLPRPPLFGHRVHPREGPVEFRGVPQDDVVDRDAVVETAGSVEVDYLVHRHRRHAIADVREGPAIAHRHERPVAEPEELPRADPEQPVALGESVPAALPSPPLDNGAGHEDAVVRRGREHLVGVLVVAVPEPVFGPSLSCEVEARVDQVLGVGEEEFHTCLPPRACTYVRTSRFDRVRMCRPVFSRSSHDRPFIPSHRPLVQRHTGATRRNSFSTAARAL